MKYSLVPYLALTDEKRGQQFAINATLCEIGLNQLSQNTALPSLYVNEES